MILLVASRAQHIGQHSAASWAAALLQGFPVDRLKLRCLVLSGHCRRVVQTYKCSTLSMEQADTPSKRRKTVRFAEEASIRTGLPEGIYKIPT